MYLRVGMPAKRDKDREQRTRARIGRKIAALFGIAGEAGDSDAGAGRSWLASYSTTTMTELLLGGPLVMKSPSPGLEDTGVYITAAGSRRTQPVPNPAPVRADLGEVTAEPISPTAIADYGPDPQAAVLLTGVNYVLAPLTDALITVLTEMKFPDVRLMMGTTSMLLSEAYRSQPLLVLAGVQASRVQHALQMEDQALVLAAAPTPDAPWRCSRLDLPWSQRAQTAPPRESRAQPSLDRDQHHTERGSPDPRRPLFVDLVQNVWSSLITQQESVAVPKQTNRIEIEQPYGTSQLLTIQDSALAAARLLTERITFGLSRSVAGTRIVVRRQPAGDFYVDFIGVATRPARVLVDRLVGIYFVDDSRRTTGTTESPVPKFDVERWRREPKLVQRAAVWAYHCAERFIVSGAWLEGEPHSTTFNSRTEQRRVLAEVAAEFFGSRDALATELRVFYHCYRIEGARRHWADAPERLGSEAKKEMGEAIGAFRDAVRDMIDLHDRGQAKDSHLTESLQPTLIDLAMLKKEVLDVGQPDLAAQAATLLRTSWAKCLQVQLSLLENPTEQPRDLETILADLATGGADHHPTMSAVLESSPALATCVAAFHSDIELAIRIQENVRRRRHAIYADEDDWPPYRQSLIDEGLLKMQRYQSCRDPERAKTIKDVAEIAEIVVATELRVQNISRKPIELEPGIELRLGLPEDVLLLTLAEYLILNGTDLVPSREGSGLKQHIAGALYQSRDCSRRRLADARWQLEPLQQYRDVLLAILDNHSSVEEGAPHLSVAG